MTWEFLYLLTRATLIIPGKDETRLCAYTLWIFFNEHSEEHWWEQNVFCSFTTTQAFRQNSAPGALMDLVISVVLYSLTQTTLMIPGKEERRVCGYTLWINSWRSLENNDETRIFWFVDHATSILTKPSTWCFEHSGDFICSVLLNLNYTDE